MNVSGFTFEIKFFYFISKYSPIYLSHFEISLNYSVKQAAQVFLATTNTLFKCIHIFLWWWKIDFMYIFLIAGQRWKSLGAKSKLSNVGVLFYPSRTSKLGQPWRVCWFVVIVHYNLFFSKLLIKFLTSKQIVLHKSAVTFFYF